MRYACGWRLLACLILGWILGALHASGTGGGAYWRVARAYIDLHVLNRLQAQQLQNVAQAAGVPITVTSDAEAAVASAACCSLFFGFLNVARRLTQIPTRV